MNGKIRGLCTMMIPMRSQESNVKRYRVICPLFIFSLLWLMASCGSNSSKSEFPPSVQTVQAVAEELNWTLDQEGTQSWEENQILYTLETADQEKISVSCALVDEKPVLMENCVVILLPDKPHFSWEDWEDEVNFAEKLFGGFSQGDIYKELLEQKLPEPEILASDSPVNLEVLSWEVDSPSGYVRVQWSMDAGTVENNFPSPTAQDWRMNFNISIYESKEAYQNTGDGS